MNHQLIARACLHQEKSMDVATRNYLTQLFNKLDWMDSDTSDSGISDGYDSDNDGRFGEPFHFPYNGSQKYVFERKFARTLRNEWLVFTKTTAPFYIVYDHKSINKTFKFVILDTLATLRLNDTHTYMCFNHKDWKMINGQFQKLNTSLETGEESMIMTISPTS